MTLQAEWVVKCIRATYGDLGGRVVLQVNSPLFRISRTTKEFCQLFSAKRFGAI